MKSQLLSAVEAYYAWQSTRHSYEHDNRIAAHISARHPPYEILIAQSNWRQMAWCVDHYYFAHPDTCLIQLAPNIDRAGRGTSPAALIPGVGGGDCAHFYEACQKRLTKGSWHLQLKWHFWALLYIGLIKATCHRNETYMMLRVKLIRYISMRELFHESLSNNYHKIRLKMYSFGIGVLL